MPELPEVETIRRALAPRLEGRTLAALEVLDPRWCEPVEPGELAAAVEGRRIERLDRRGKYLVMALEGEVHLIMHLRMTGTLLYDPEPDVRYQRVRFELGDGHELRFCDPRRFGTGELAIGDAAREAFFAARVGVEPLEDGFDGGVLRALAQGRRAPVKAFLLDQRGWRASATFYADEALFRSRIHPLRPAGALTRRQYDELAVPSRTRSPRVSRPAARPSTTSAIPTGSAAASSTSSSSTCARARPACGAGPKS